MRSITPGCKPRTYTTKFIFKRKKRKQRIHICCLVVVCFSKAMAGFCRKFKAIWKHTEENQSPLQFYLPKITYANILEYRLYIPGRQVCMSVCAHTHTYFTKTSVYVCLYTRVLHHIRTYLYFSVFFLGCAQHCQICSYERGCSKDRQLHTCAREAGTCCHLDLWHCWNSLDTAIEPELYLNILLFQPPHNHHLMFTAPGSPWILKSTHAAVSYIK